MPGLSANRLKNLLMPLPPLSEQKRIVSQLETLMPIIQCYETAQIKLDILNTEIYSILGKSILQEAIQGKLVNQCSEDESASVLLERIQEEKKKLVKEGVLKKKDLTESHIFKGDDNKYFVLNYTFSSIRFSNLLQHFSVCSLTMSDSYKNTLVLLGFYSLYGHISTLSSFISSIESTTTKLYLR